jgi:hypothetical protein
MSVRNWIVIGLSAATFIIVLKVLVNKYSVLGPLEKPVNMI